MFVNRLINRPCTLRVRSVDEGVERTESLGDPTETVCYIEQRNRDEDGDFGEVATGEWRGYLRAGTEVTDRSVLTVDGEDYEVEGPPWAAADPLRSSRISHIELNLKTVS